MKFPIPVSVPRPVSAFHAVLLLAASLPTQAAVVAVGNPGFEGQTVPDGEVSLVFPAGWSAYQAANLDGLSDTVALLNPTGTDHFPAGAAEGRNVAVVFMGGSATGEAGLQQTLSATLQADMRYTLDVEVGNIASGTANFGFFNLEGFPGYRVELLAGSTVLASDNNSLAGSIPEGEFRTSTLQVSIGASHADLGQALTIRLVNLNLDGNPDAPGIEVNFDDVRLDATPVPEPAVSVAASAVGLAAWAFLRGRGRRLRGH